MINPIFYYTALTIINGEVTIIPRQTDANLKTIIDEDNPNSFSTVTGFRTAMSKWNTAGLSMNQKWIYFETYDQYIKNNKV